MPRNSAPMASRQISMLLLLSLAPFGSAATQVSSPPFLQRVARISLIARLPSSVRLSENLIRVSADVGDRCGEVTVPVDVSWNVEPWVQEVQLMGSFLDSASALSDGRGHVLAAANLELLGEDSTWTTLPQSKAAEARSSGFPLATIAIAGRGRQNRLEIPLHFRICRSDGDFTPGTYSGEIELRSSLR